MNKDLNRLIKSAVGTTMPAPPKPTTPPPMPQAKSVTEPAPVAAPAPDAAARVKQDNAARNTRIATNVANSSIAPAIAKTTGWIGDRANDVQQATQNFASTPDNYFRNMLTTAMPGWLQAVDTGAVGAGAVGAGAIGGGIQGLGAAADFVHNIYKRVPNMAVEGLSRMGNAGNAAISGNLGEAAKETGQGMARLGGAAAAAVPGATAFGSKALGAAGRLAGGIGSSLATDTNGAAPAPATATVAQATGQPAAKVEQAAADSGFSGEEFQKMLPFLMAILPMLFGGGAGGSNFSNPNYTPSSVDRMAAGSMFG